MNAVVGSCSKKIFTFESDVVVTEDTKVQRCLEQVEIKNMNSFSAMQKAIEFEIDRQVALLEEGDKIKQETRLWEEGSQVPTSPPMILSLLFKL